MRCGVVARKLGMSRVFSDDGEHIPVEKGSFWRTPSDVEHSVIAGPEGCVILDVFAPPREEYKTAGRGFGTNSD